MRERIKMFMDYKGISASDFAGMLDVQRSNISHILSGRNLPGASFIEKLLIVFPELNARWLFLGEGTMIEKGEKKDIPGPKENRLIQIDEEMNDRIVEKPVKESRLDNAGLPDREIPVVKSVTKKEIERIVILYSDKSFSEYRPE